MSTGEGKEVAEPDPAMSESSCGSSLLLKSHNKYLECRTNGDIGNPQTGPIRDGGVGGMQNGGEGKEVGGEGGGNVGEEKSSRSGDSLATSVLADFEVLRFRNNFLEVSETPAQAGVVVEELRMRRAVHIDNDERIKQLLSQKHELELKLEEERDRYSSAVAHHSQQEEEIRKQHAEQFKHLQEEKAKCILTAEGKGKEVKALKDEIRALSLARYTLEKKVQEQECQLHLQTSSRESCLTQMTKLEHMCTSAVKQVSQITEHMEKLKTNVKAAVRLNKKLMQTNTHQRCLLEKCQSELESCREEMVGIRADMEGREVDVSERIEGSLCLKSREQELKMHVELNKQLQAQLAGLREEHQNTIQRMKEAHMLIERHVDANARLGTSEAILQEEVCSLKDKIDHLDRQLTHSRDKYQTLEKDYHTVDQDWENKCSDLNRRLRSLQSDYSELQEAHDLQQEERNRAVHKLQEYLLSSSNAAEEVGMAVNPEMHPEMHPVNPVTQDSRPRAVNSSAETELVSNSEKCEDLKSHKPVGQDTDPVISHDTSLDKPVNEDPRLNKPGSQGTCSEQHVSQNTHPDKPVGQLIMQLDRPATQDGLSPEMPVSEGAQDKPTGSSLSPDVFSDTRKSPDHNAKLMQISKDNHATKLMAPRVHLQKIEVFATTSHSQVNMAKEEKSTTAVEESMDQTPGIDHDHRETIHDVPLPNRSPQTRRMSVKRRASEREVITEDDSTSTPKRLRGLDLTQSTTADESELSSSLDARVTEHAAIKSVSVRDDNDAVISGVQLVSQQKSKSLPSSPTATPLVKTRALSQSEGDSKSLELHMINRCLVPQDTKTSAQRENSLLSVAVESSHIRDTPTTRVSDSALAQAGMTTTCTHDKDPPIDPVNCNVMAPNEGTAPAKKETDSTRLEDKMTQPPCIDHDKETALGVEEVPLTAVTREGVTLQQVQPLCPPTECPVKETSPTPSLVFSSEEEEGEERLLDTQMNRQIDRVQVFLKMDRLKIPRHNPQTKCL